MIFLLSINDSLKNLRVIDEITPFKNQQKYNHPPIYAPGIQFFY